MDGQQRTGHGLGQSAPRVPSVVPGVDFSSALESLSRSLGDARQTISPQAPLRRPQAAPAAYLSQVRRASLGGRAGQIANVEELTALLQSRGTVQNSPGLASLAKEQPKPKQGISSQGLVFSATAPLGVGQGRLGSHMVLPSRPGGVTSSRPGGGHPQVQKSVGRVGRMERIHQNNVQVKTPAGSFLIGQPQHQSHGEKDKQQQQQTLQGQPATRHIQGQRYPVPLSALQRGGGLQVVHKTGVVGGGGGGGGEPKAKQGEAVRVVTSGGQRQAVAQAQQGLGLNMLQFVVNQKAPTQGYVYVLRDEKGGVTLVEGDNNTVAQLTNNQGMRIADVLKVPTRGANTGEQMHVDGNGRVSPSGANQIGSRSLSAMDNVALVRVPQDQLQQQTTRPAPRDSFPKHTTTRIIDRPSSDMEKVKLCEPPSRDIADHQLQQQQHQSPVEAPLWRAVMKSMEIGTKSVSRPPSAARSVCSGGMDTDVITAAESLQGLSTGGSAAKKMRMSGDGEGSSRRVPGSSSGLMEEDSTRGGGEFSGLDLLLDAATRAGDEVGRNIRIKRPSRVRVEAEETESLLNEKHGRMVASRKIRHFTRQSLQSDLSRQTEHPPPPAAFKTHERYRGVTPTSNGKFIARCRFKGGAVQIGVFDCAHDASKAYDRVILGLRGPQASTNHSRQEYLGFEISNAKRAFDVKVLECVQIRRGSPRHWVEAAKRMLHSGEIHGVLSIFPALGGDVEKITEVLEGIRDENPEAFTEALGRMETHDGAPAIEPSRRRISPAKMSSEPFDIVRELGEQGKSIEEALDFVEHNRRDSGRKASLRRGDRPDPYPYVAEMLRAMVSISKKWEGKEKLVDARNRGTTGSGDSSVATEEPCGNAASSAAGTSARTPVYSRSGDVDMANGDGSAGKKRGPRASNEGGIYFDHKGTAVSDFVPLLANGSQTGPTSNGIDQVGKGSSLRALPGQIAMDAIDASLKAVRTVSPVPRRASESPVVINGNRVRGRRPAPRRGSGRVTGQTVRAPPSTLSDDGNSSVPQNTEELEANLSPRVKRGGEGDPPDSMRRKKRRVTRTVYRGQRPSRGLKTGRVRRPSLGGLSRDRASEYATSSNNTMNGEEDGGKVAENGGGGLGGGGPVDSANIDRRVSCGEKSVVMQDFPPATAHEGEMPKSSEDLGYGVGGTGRCKSEASGKQQSNVDVEVIGIREGGHVEEDQSGDGVRTRSTAIEASGDPELEPISIPAESDEKAACLFKLDAAEYDSVEVVQQQEAMELLGPPGFEPPSIPVCRLVDEEEEVTIVGEGSVTGAGVMQQGCLVASKDNPFSISSFEETEEGVITVNGSQLVVQLAEDEEGETHWERGSKTATTSMDLSETVEVPWQGENESAVDSVRWLRLLASSLWPKKRGGGMICRAFDRSFSGGRHRERMLDIRKCFFKDIDEDDDV
ncbi:hypothetical protein BSKO_00488 [Bryopsis sp. KO-2023]|nr:hypothetical protein BSKO_00488 [Bryopsis sp. KO-2023]